MSDITALRAQIEACIQFPERKDTPAYAWKVGAYDAFHRVLDIIDKHIATQPPQSVAPDIDGDHDQTQAPPRTSERPMRDELMLYDSNAVDENGVLYADTSLIDGLRAVVESIDTLNDSLRSNHDESAHLLTRIADALHPGTFEKTQQ
jgi:hypothetical protein